MANKPSYLRTPELSKETVFTTVVYRIPALIYLGDNKILSFAERRKTTNDASTVALDMRTGKVNRNQESNPEVTIEVIIYSNWFICIFLVMTQFLIASMLS